MKFRGVKPITANQTAEQYLEQTLRHDLLQLVDGLHRLSLQDNLESFTYEGTIAAGVEVTIPNRLSTTPSGRLVIKHSGDPGIVDGTTPWDSSFVYLENVGSAPATVKVIYFK